MTNYRRSTTCGATWFFTVNLARRRDNRLLIDHLQAFRDAVARVRSRHPFTIEAMVVLPDHWHALWTLPRDDADFGMRIRLIKSAFSRSLPSTEYRSPSRIARAERGVWQRRFWEHQIRDERDFAAHVDYIHFNPVRHGLVARAVDWPHTSFHRFVERGELSPEWASEPEDGVGRE